MTAIKDNTWFLSYSWTVANWAKIINKFLRFLVFWKFFYAIRVKARHTFRFSSWSTTVMTTRKNFITWFFHHINTFWLSTYVLECRKYTWRRLFHLFSTESARFGKILIACFSNMIRLCVAFSTEILVTLRTSDSVLS